MSRQARKITCHTRSATDRQHLLATACNFATQARNCNLCTWPLPRSVMIAMCTMRTVSCQLKHFKSQHRWHNRERCTNLETCKHGLTRQVLTDSSRICLCQSHISSHNIELHHGSHVTAAFRSICGIAGDSIHVGDAAGNNW